MVKRLLISDRWGDAVWQGENFLADGSFGWDGLFRGQEMQPGVMAWICEVELMDGSTQKFAGDVTLIRYAFDSLHEERFVLFFRKKEPWFDLLSRIHVLQLSNRERSPKRKSVGRRLNLRPRMMNQRKVFLCNIK